MIFFRVYAYFCPPFIRKKLTYLISHPWSNMVSSEPSETPEESKCSALLRGGTHP